MTERPIQIPQTTHGEFEPERFEILIDRETIANRVRELGAQITREHQGTEIVVVCVLKGAIFFCSDLLRQLGLPVRVEFLGVRSYGDATVSSGAVEITHDLTAPIEGKVVLVVEDIVDSGLTSRFLLDQLQARRAARVLLCSLLHKPARTQLAVNIDYLGFTIDDRFVVGYGLDVAQRYRHLPDLRIFPTDA